MYQFLNTLYVTLPEAYLHLDHETLKVEVNKETKMQVPLHHLGAIFCFGNILVSPATIYKCAEEGRSIVMFGQSGRFKARVEGPLSGNVLLRKSQHEISADKARSLEIARNIVAGKIQNSRQVIQRSARDANDQSEAEILKNTAFEMGKILDRLRRAENIDQVRGHEGEAARRYFDSFQFMISADRKTFNFDGRSRRPPQDSVNALLSFLYALLLNDCVSAAEGVGLDPQVGFLHELRPGRPALGLDLMEEFRSIVADRLVLTLINRRQVTAKSFVERPGGAVQLLDEARKDVITEYQRRKQEEIQHPLLKEKVPFGLVPHIQARLIARHLRGDLDIYTPYLHR